jgi:hypothetical protein
MSSIHLNSSTHQTRQNTPFQPQWAKTLPEVQSGIVRFDVSLGSLGGCPYAPGASGNISSEDAISMLDAMELAQNA